MRVVLDKGKEVRPWALARAPSSGIGIGQEFARANRSFRDQTRPVRGGDLLKQVGVNLASVTVWSVELLCLMS